MTETRTHAVRFDAGAPSNLTALLMLAGAVLAATAAGIAALTPAGPGDAAVAGTALTLSFALDLRWLLRNHRAAAGPPPA